MDSCLLWLEQARSCHCLCLLFLCPCSCLQVGVLLIRHVLLQEVIDGDNPAVIELSFQCHLLLLHLRLHLHHLKCGVVMVTILHCVQLLSQVLLGLAVWLAVAGGTDSKDGNHDEQSSAGSQDGYQGFIICSFLGDFFVILVCQAGFHFATYLHTVKLYCAVVVWGPYQGAVSILHTRHQPLAHHHQIFLFIFLMPAV